MTRESVYIETSIISYLCSRPSRDLVIAANQEVTREWWEQRRGEYDLYISDAVLDEIGQGNPEASAKRLELVRPLSVLSPNAEVEKLIGALMNGMHIPDRLRADIAHISMAAIHGMDYLLTLNCSHIANPHWQKKIREIVTRAGYEVPVMCVPQLLMEIEGDLP